MSYETWDGLSSQLDPFLECLWRLQRVDRMAATCTVIALVRDLLVIASVVAARVRAAVTSGNAAGAQGK